MHLIIFSGTTEEYLRIAPVLQQLGISISPTGENPKRDAQPFTHPLASSDVEDTYVNIEEAKRILTRLPLSENIKNVLGVLNKAVDSTVPSSELKSVNDHNTDQFRAMMGAFARRVATTAGKKAFFWKEWDQQNGEYVWKLPLSVRLALKETQVWE